MNGGELVAAVLRAQGVEFLYTLVGGHISPILVVARRAGIRIVDTRRLGHRGLSRPTPPRAHVLGWPW